MVINFLSIHDVTPVLYNPNTGCLKVPGFESVIIHSYNMGEYTREEALADVQSTILSRYPHLRKCR